MSNIENNPEEQEEAGQSGQDGRAVRRLSLGDKEDVYQICFAFIENVSEVFVQAATGEISSEAAEEQMANVNEWLVAALLGRIPGIEPKEGWTGEPLARNLIAVLSGRIAKLPREAQQQLSSVEGVLMFSAMNFMHEVQEMVSGINHVPEPEAEKALEQQGRAVHELCGKWADRFTGGGRPDYILPGSI